MKGTLGELINRISGRQKSYAAAMAPGAPAFAAFVDAARYAHAFDDGPIGNVSAERMAGRRDLFWHMWRYLNLTPEQIVEFYPKVQLGDDA